VQAGQLLTQAAQLDPGVRFDLDIDTAFRDALGGIVPATWIVPVEVANSKKAQEQQIQKAQQAAQAMAMGADVATKVGGAVEQMGTAAQSVQAARGAQQGVAA
jgi:transcriptional accessory protein Tex/SPT6